MQLSVLQDAPVSARTAAQPTPAPAATPFPVDIEAVAKTALSPSEYRAALALVEAMLPGSARIPAGDERTVLRAEDVVRAFHPVMIKPFGVALNALDNASVVYTGRPFHALDGNRQQQLLRTWENSPVMRTAMHVLGMLFKFAHFDATHVFGAQGRTFAKVHNAEKPRHFSQIFRADEWEGDDVIECDVAIVGTGAGGAVVGKELAERGHAVVFIEEGEHYTREAFSGSMVRAHGVFYRNALVVGNAPMPAFIGRMLGGSTAVNGGTSFRTPPWVLNAWCEKLGTNEFSPDSMLPMFERVESVLQVGIPDRRFIGPIADIMARGCDAYGWHHAPIARNAVGCEGKGFCDFGCATGAKRSTEISYLPGALNRGAIALTGLRADRLILDKGRAVGVEGVSAKGKRLTVRSRAVVFAGGGIPTPAWLLERDLCNSSGEVGKNLTLHPSGAVVGVFDERTDPAEYIPQAYHSAEFLRQGVLLSAAQPDYNIGSILFPYTGRRLMEAMDLLPHVASVAVVVRDSEANGRVRQDFHGKPVVTYNMLPRDMETYKFGLIRAAEMLVAAGAKSLLPALVGADFVDAKIGVSTLRKHKLSPSEMALTSYHPLGTCKMGTDPRRSVVDVNHQTHDIPGFYIVDGSTVPSALGVNPQITIMAMATRAAGKIDQALS